MSNKAILCVDDEAIILDSLTQELERLLGDEYLYEMAESADEGFEVIQNLAGEDIELLVIISDWLMPGMKGDEFLAKVHQMFPRIVKIMLTGQADQAAIERAKQQANLYACVEKPWSDQELMEIIQTSLQQP